MEQEIQRIWMLVSELSDQLNQNNRVAAELHSQIQTLKEQAETNSKTTKLNRYNTDLTNELFDSELERATVAQVIENRSLLQENRQLTSLLNEYEQTLETVMTKFQQHTQAAIEKELALRRHYEGMLASNEEQTSTQTYNLYALSDHLHRLKLLLQLTVKGETAATIDPSMLDNIGMSSHMATGEGQESDLEVLARSLEEAEVDEDEGLDWAAERETEIERLEKENTELRRQLGILEDIGEKDGLERSSSPFLGPRHGRTSSTPFGSGFTTSSSIPSPQGSSLVPNPFSPAYPGAQGYNPPSTFQPERRFNLPTRGVSLGPAPPQVTARNTFAEGSLGGRQQPPFPNFFRGPPNRERLDLAGGQPPLL
ncbi:hypothetical protein FRB91_011911 [Serendipita sp. 411]|nr:hypothetical protein FRC19_006776 [Serendipita sp. 401]KAG8842196.1 hypothetical protein FRC20_004581 [Serendipita sp. 405]KAG8856987.1 hypothetical protein FRB91_011911 [Serendipita sp. 411]